MASGGSDKFPQKIPKEEEKVDEQKKVPKSPQPEEDWDTQLTLEAQLTLEEESKKPVVVPECIPGKEEEFVLKSVEKFIQDTPPKVKMNNLEKTTMECEQFEQQLLQEENEAEEIDDDDEGDDVEENDEP